MSREALQLADRLRRDRRTERYRVLVLVVAFGGLRFGGATALRRSDVLTGGRLRIDRSVRRSAGRWVVGEPKTEAGRRFPSLSPEDLRTGTGGGAVLLTSARHPRRRGHRPLVRTTSCWVARVIAT